MLWSLFESRRTDSLEDVCAAYSGQLTLPPVGLPDSSVELSSYNRSLGTPKDLRRTSCVRLSDYARHSDATKTLSATGISVSAAF